jgi:hypothetical protein
MSHPPDRAQGRPNGTTEDCLGVPTIAARQVIGARSRGRARVAAYDTVACQQSPTGPMLHGSCERPSHVRGLEHERERSQHARLSAIANRAARVRTGSCRTDGAVGPARPVSCRPALDHCLNNGLLASQGAAQSSYNDQPRERRQPLKTRSSPVLPDQLEVRNPAVHDHEIDRASPTKWSAM